MLVNQKMNALRKKKKLKLSDLEDRTGITVSTLSRYERGTIKFIPTESVRKIAASLDTTFEDLTEGDLRYASTESIKNGSLTRQQSNQLRFRATKILNFFIPFTELTDSIEISS